MRKEYTIHIKQKRFCSSTENIVRNRKNKIWLIEKFNRVKKHFKTTAKLNNLDIYKYLNYLLDSLPQLDGIQTEESLERFLLWSDELHDDVRNINGEYRDIELR